MLRVMAMHRDAAYALDRDHCPEALFSAATADWDDAFAWAVNTATETHRLPSLRRREPSGC